MHIHKFPQKIVSSLISENTLVELDISANNISDRQTDAIYEPAPLPHNRNLQTKF